MPRALCYLLFLCSLFCGPLRAQQPLEVLGRETDAPYKVQARIEAGVLRVQLDLDDGWHVYAADVGGGSPVRLSFAKDSGWLAKGPLQLPADDAGKLSGKVVLRQPLRPGKAGAPLRASLSLMACDPLQCLPPAELEIRPGKPGPKVLLLSSDPALAATKRLRDLLQQRGMRVTSASYEGFDPKARDTHDVILAASQLFRQERGARKHLHRLQRSETPLVAVGFLGTILLEDQKYAITSGYI